MRTGFCRKKRGLLDFDNQTIALNSTVQRNAKEGVVIDFFVVFANGGTERTATGHDTGDSSHSSDDEKLFHSKSLFLYLFYRCQNFTVKLWPCLNYNLLCNTIQAFFQKKNEFPLKKQKKIPFGSCCTAILHAKLLQIFRRFGLCTLHTMEHGSEKGGNQLRKKCSFPRSVRNARGVHAVTSNAPGDPPRHTPDR